MLKQTNFSQHVITFYINNSVYLCGNCYFKCKIEIENYKTNNTKRIVFLKHLLCDDVGELIYKNIIEKNYIITKKLY